MADTPKLTSKAIEKLGLPAGVAGVLNAIHAEVADSYRDAFIEMIQVMKQQASALDRIQTTLNVLVSQFAPQFGGQKLPVAFSVAADGNSADVAKAIVVSDPIATGYTLSQSDLANALTIGAADVSVLVRAFKLKEDGQCAVVVRHGKGTSNEMVNYHARAVTKFMELVKNPPRSLGRDQTRALERARRQLEGRLTK